MKLFEVHWNDKQHLQWEIYQPRLTQSGQDVVDTLTMAFIDKDSMIAFISSKQGLTDPGRSDGAQS